MQVQTYSDVLRHHNTDSIGIEPAKKQNQARGNIL